MRVNSREILSMPAASACTTTGVVKLCSGSSQSLSFCKKVMIQGADVCRFCQLTTHHATHQPPLFAYLPLHIQLPSNGSPYLIPHGQHVMRMWLKLLLLCPVDHHSDNHSSTVYTWPSQWNILITEVEVKEPGNSLTCGLRRCKVVIDGQTFPIFPSMRLLERYRYHN